MIQKLFGAAVAALVLAPAAGAAEVCDKAVCKLQTLWLVAPVASVLALIVAVVFYKKMMSANEGSDKMKEIAGYVREGAMAYLFRQYKIVGWVFAVLFVLFAVLAYFGLQNPFVPVAFLTGGFFSGLCGYIGTILHTPSITTRVSFAVILCTAPAKKGIAISAAMIIDFFILFYSFFK